MVVIFSGKISDINSNKAQNDINDITGAIKIKLDTAKSVHDGYTEMFYLPNTINSKNYNITITGNYLTLKVGEKESFALIPKITGNFTKGKNTIYKNKGIFIN